MPASTMLREIQSRVIGVVPAQARGGERGFVLYLGGSREGQYSDSLPAGVVCLAYERDKNYLQSEAGMRIARESYFAADPQNPFEKLPDLVEEIRDGLRAMQMGPQRKPIALVYCDSSIPLPDLIGFLHALKSESPPPRTTEKTCRVCGYATKGSHWVCPNCAAPNWENITLMWAVTLGMGVYWFFAGELLTWGDFAFAVGILVAVNGFVAFFVRRAMHKVKSRRAHGTQGGAARR